MTQHVLYIHGFNSSPLSNKAEQTRKFLAQHYPKVKFSCPQLISNPNSAIAQLEALLAQGSVQQPDTQWLLIGSSLGGYFSTYLAEKYNLLAVLVNPAVKPYELLLDYLGEQVNPYTGEVYQVEVDYIEALKRLEQASIVKNNYLLMVQTGDEVLDYRQAVDKYQNDHMIKQQGGDHSFIDYDKMLPQIAEFFQVK